jgi:hypothetical protein
LNNANIVGKAIRETLDGEVKDLNLSEERTLSIVSGSTPANGMNIREIIRKLIGFC